MKKTDPNAPSRLKAGDPDAALYEVVDDKTGHAIPRVIEADAEKGTLTRFAVENGNLVRDGDAFATVKEERAIRFRLVAAATAEEMVGDGEAGAQA